MDSSPDIANQSAPQSNLSALVGGGDCTLGIATSRLLDRLRAGDEAALTVLMARYSRFVHFLARSFHLRCNDVDHEDLIQLTWMTLWDSAIHGNLDAVDSERGLMGWLRIVTRNAGIDRVRKMEKRLNREIPLEMEEVNSPAGADLEQHTYVGEVLEWIRSTDELNENERKSLLLYVVGCSAVDIAQETGLSVVSVPKYLRRAKTAVIDHFGDRTIVLDPPKGGFDNENQP